MFLHGERICPAHHHGVRRRASVTRYCRGDLQSGQRAARLCKVAEKYAPSAQSLIYIIGTEVPIPGGETDDMQTLSVTSVERLNQTLETHREAFDQQGLTSVWPRIVSVVTQPGVDFSHNSVHTFQPEEAADLAKAISGLSGLTFEAHSTDYKSSEALKLLVTNHFFFLKVGPELTFRLREAVFALASIEKQIKVKDTADLIDAVDRAMDESPTNWISHYQGDFDTVQQLRHFSYSDRIRYYWSVPSVRDALEKLIFNLENQRLPATIVSQYFHQRPFGVSEAEPRQLISNHVKSSIERYYKACGYE